MLLNITSKVLDHLSIVAGVCKEIAWLKKWISNKEQYLKNLKITK